MQIVTSYSVKIKKYNHIFKETISAYRKAVDFFIEVAFGEWNVLKEIDSIHYRQSHMEKICIRTAAHPEPEYPFETQEKCDNQNPYSQHMGLAGSFFKERRCRLYKTALH